MNPNSILFLYEGETEREFYNILFQTCVEQRSIRITKSNMHGVGNINKKVKKKIAAFLDDKKSMGQNKITVIVAHDRDGDRATESKLNVMGLKEQFCLKKSRVEDIWEVIATKDLETWLFHDVEGLFDFLNIPQKKRNYAKYLNVESLNNVSLSSLFRTCDKLYLKGDKAEGLLLKLDIRKILAKVPELQDLVVQINSLCI